MKDLISLELGSGGQLMRDFISRLILSHFANPILEELLDASHLPGGYAFTTDSYVIDPIFFAGGDIGSLAINGTVNDLIVSGAKPEFISLALIIEEGFAWNDLKRILESIKQAASSAGVQIVTGDTKVVRRGQADKIYINTSGIGQIIARPNLNLIVPGDKLIVTGPIGDHSVAILVARGDFGFEAPVQSDCAALTFLLPLWQKGVRWMRDITRGGLATILWELAEKIPFPILIEEKKIPLSPSVRAVAEFLGIDPLYLACEGRAILLVPAERSDEILSYLKEQPLAREASIIGQIEDRIGRPGELLLRTKTGGLRLLEPLTTELLPRIC
ncbi:MAG: hydrogenase expression/formation protein HypE [Candidatus Aminicenantes bacterium]|nr:hydrogenase expression/formation protein HypE [Candidatus Aminicenantes bacterium]